MPKRKAKTTSVRRRRYTPRKKTTRRRKKTMLSKVTKLSLPAGAGISFLAPYLKRSKATGKPVMDLLKEDIENFDTTAAVNRLKGSLGEIAVPLGAGVVVQQTRVAGKYSTLAGDFLMGMGIGTALKAIIDPPELPHSMRSQRGGRIIDMQPQANGVYVAKNPYEGGY